jgi:outer membrane protein assembly factor BamB
VQKFDAGGKFQYLIQVTAGRNDTHIIADLAVDLNEHLYVVRVGDILVFDAKNGEYIGSYEGQSFDTFYEAAASDVTNVLHAIHATASDNDLIMLAENGDVLDRYADIVTQVNPDDAAMELEIAVDGLGWTYILSFFGNQVYIYNEEGIFQDRFGSQGRQPGQIDNPSGIAVDGQRNIYVLANDAINQYDSRGTYLASLPIAPGSGALRDLAMDIQGNLYTITGKGQVIKFAPMQP